MKLRLNMLELKCNYKGVSKDLKCDLCKVENDTTEHLFTCQIIKNALPEIPNLNIITTDNKQAYTQTFLFIKEVLKIKGIDSTKRVKHNISATFGT